MSDTDAETTAGPAPAQLGEYDYSAITDPLKQLSRSGHDMATVFRDFVDLAMMVFTRDRDGIDDIHEKYERPSVDGPEPAELFQTATRELLLAYNDVQHDVIGAVYEQLELQNDHMGQYFTGDDVTTLMARLLGVESGESRPETTAEGNARLTTFAPDGGDESDESDQPETVHDPCCGSGRLLVSRALETDGDAVYTGIDKSELAAKMAAVNMAMMNNEAQIAHGDSLTMEIYQSWTVTPTPLQMGYITHQS